jgi:hypothetical protein
MKTNLQEEVASAQLVEGLFSEEQHQGIVDYLDNYGKFLPLHYDDNFTRRYAHAGYLPFFTAIHQQLAGFASEMAGRALKPSYAFLSLYDEGGVCPLHIDREQCFFTVDYLIRQDSPKPWPIYVTERLDDEARFQIETDGLGHPETTEQIEAVKEAHEWQQLNMEPNDAVLYSGTHSWHYRDRLPSGTADLVFFHFVGVGFDGYLG